MSWLERQKTRPYAVSALAAAIGLNPADPRLTSQLVQALGMSRGWVLRCRTLGLTEQQADEWACRAGRNPMEIWPLWGSGLRGAALVNAIRDCCPCGRPYDRVDSRGDRVCSACARERVARLREKTVKILVTAPVTEIADWRAPPVPLSDRMAPAPSRPRQRVTARVPVDVAERINVLADQAGITVSAWACMTLTAAVGRTTSASEEVA